METVIEALRPGVRRHIAAGVAALAVATLYVVWALASPNSLLAQSLRGSTAQAASPRAAAAAPPAAPGALPGAAEADQPPALIFRALSPQAAAQVNAAMPFWSGPNPPAAPFKLPVTDAAERAQAVQCLTEAVYYEAGQEPLPGAQAVAQVVLNRLRHPLFPKTVCGVVFQGYEQPTGCQFTFTCDGARMRPADPVAWARSKAVAEKALAGFVMKDVGQATHYHAQYVVPYWMPTMNKLTAVGQHIFYRWPGPDGRLVAPYGGSELVAMLLVPPGAMTPAKPAPLPIQLASAHAADLAISAPAVFRLDGKGQGVATLPASAGAVDDSGAQGEAARSAAAAPEPAKLDVVKAAPPELGKLSTRAALTAPPAAVTMMAAPACAGPACGAWR